VRRIELQPASATLVVPARQRHLVGEGVAPAGVNFDHNFKHNASARLSMMLQVEEK
jgi:hypothetical protein